MDSALSLAVLNAAYASRFPAQQLAGLRMALDAGKTVAVGWQGDSTGDSDGTAATNPQRFPVRFAQKIAARYPGYHVMAKHFNAGTLKFDPWVVLQSQAAGRRYFNLAGRSLRWNPATAPNYASGNLDLRALIAPTKWSPGTGPDATILGAMVGTQAFPADAKYRFLLKNDGSLGLTWYENNGSPVHQNNYATATTQAAAGVADGAFVWVRATLEIVVGTSATIKFYWSPANDGVTWTQIGSTLTATGALGAMNPGSTCTTVECGAYGWQPASAPFTGKVSEVQVRDGVDGPTLTSCALEDWDRYGDSTTTIGGAPTLYLVNASASGQAMPYFDGANLAKMTPNYGQVVQFFNDGHNEVANQGQTLWTTPYKKWVSDVQARLPRAAIVAVGQNPHYNWANEAAYGYSHPQRIMELAALAAQQGWGFANIYQAFMSSSQGLANLIGPDGLHPVDAGYEVGALALMGLLGFAS